MSSRQHKGKLCVYCGARPARTGDHIFAREFFPIKKRGNLPQAPTCDRCNTAKSKLEGYLTTVLPFGALHAEAVADLSTMVPRRLKGNAKLRRELETGMGEVWQTDASGVAKAAMTIPFKPEYLEGWAEYVAKGLTWHHWKVIVPPDHAVLSACLNRAGTALFATLFAANSRNKAAGDLGDGMFVYRGAQGTDNPAMSVWEISVLGGVNIGSDPKAPGEISTKLGVVTGSRRTTELFDAVRAH